MENFKKSKRDGKINLEEDRKHNFTGVWTNEKADVMKRAGETLSILVVTVTESGGTSEKTKAKVGENSVELRVETYTPERSTAFWKEVDKLLSPNR